MTIAVLLLLSLGVQDEPVQIEPLKGPTVTADLKPFRDNKVIYGKNQRSISIAELKKITFVKKSKPSSKGSIKLQCRGNSFFQCHAISLKGDRVVIADSAGNATIQVPRGFVSSMQLEKEIDKNQWAKLLDNARDSDALVVKREERLDVLEGIIKGIDAKQVTFEIQGRTANVQLSKLAGILFFQPKKDESAPYRLTDQALNQIGFEQIEFDGETFSLSLAGYSIQIKSTDVLSIDFSAGVYTSLSDLTPESINWKPFLRAKIPDKGISDLIETVRENKIVWSRDKSFGEPIAMEFETKATRENPAGRVIYDSGVSILGGSEIVFSIPEGVVAFEADAGIQMSNHKLGAVYLEIFVDGKNVWNKQITASDASQHKIDIPVRGERLKLIVGYGKANDVGDVLSLGNARLRKR